MDHQRGPDDYATAIQADALGMTSAEMEAEARQSELRVEVLQQLTSELSGSRVSLPPDGHDAPGPLLWRSPTYGAPQGASVAPGGFSFPRLDDRLPAAPIDGRRPAHEYPRLAQPTYRVVPSAVQQHGYSPVNHQSPLLTPVLPSAPDPAAQHLMWLQQNLKYDAECAGARSPAVLESLMRQMESTTNAMHGITTPPLLEGCVCARARGTVTV